MAFELTARARAATEQLQKQPNLVLKIDGLDTIYSSSAALKLIRIGDEDLEIGDDWVIGGINQVANQETVLSLDGSTTSIKQQLEIDKGRGSSISSMELSLIDFNQSMTQLISPGVILEDILGRKVKVYLGFADNTLYPEDYITVFRGIIDDIKAEAGRIKINIAHPDQKKRQRIYEKIETTLTGNHNNSTTTITVASTDNFLDRITGPNGSEDASFTSYVRIDDEIISYTGITPTTFTGCTRGTLGTVAAAHDDEANVDSYYRLQGNVVDLALKFMLSGWNDYYIEDQPCTNFNLLFDLTARSNCIFFSNLNVQDEYGLVIGDYLTTTGATNGANNVTLKAISGITVDENGSYIDVDDVTFVNEATTDATVSFRSQYDTLPAGLQMSPDEVDVTEHLRLQQIFLSSFEYDFYLKDTIDKADEFLEQNVYKPAGAYSLPRKAQSSMGFFIGPLPTAGTVTLNEKTITKPDTLKIRRTINKNFFNTIVYRYEVDPLNDKFLRGVVTTDSTSLNRIKVGTRALVVDASGMRTTLTGLSNAQSASNRRLTRFRFGAEFIEGMEVFYSTGFNLEIGDIVILDASRLELVDTSAGVRGKTPKFFEICNKSIDIKLGKIQIDLIDTGFEGFNKYGLVGPSSRIKAGISATEFVIEQAFRSPFGAAEYKKWQRYPNCTIKVRSSDFTTRFGQGTIQSFSGNTITTSSLGFTPQSGDIMELAQYDFAGLTDDIKLRYVFLATLTGGDDPYLML